MSDFRPLSAVEQLAGHLREQLLRGSLGEVLPGTDMLVRTTGVSRKTVVAAVRQLETEGLVENAGQGRSRRINLPQHYTAPHLRVQILLYAPDDSKSYYNVDLQHRLLEAGHSAHFASKSLVELGRDTERIARFVARSPADAWVVFSGSRQVLQWFAEQSLPTFALAGRRRGVPIASTGPDKVPALRTAVRRLVELGHHRIVMLAREVRRVPSPGEFERVFLDELAAHGIQHGSYNLPHWEESAVGLQRLLDTLFRHTPPTAMIIEEAYTFIAARQHLAQHGILAPRDVSLICDDPDPAFAWCRPTVAHIHWDGSQWARRIVRWTGNLARGKEDLRQSFTRAEFIEGGTVGPVPTRHTRIA